MMQRKRAKPLIFFGDVVVRIDHTGGMQQSTFFQRHPLRFAGRAGGAKQATALWQVRLRQFRQAGWRRGQIRRQGHVNAAIPPESI